MPVSNKSITKKKRVNISNNEQKYQKLLVKHRNLKLEFTKYKQSHERKISLLRCQLKHTLKFVGVKLQNLETRLLWYQKQWKHQQSQMTKTSKFDKNVKNKCIQADINYSIKTNPENSNSNCSSKTNSKKSSKQCSIRSSISLTSINDNEIINAEKSIESIKSAKYDIVIPSLTNTHNNNKENIKEIPPLTISKNPIQDNIIMNDLWMNDKALSDLPKDAIAKHNQLITRLRARLDTMSDILTSTRDKLHSEFDHMSFPSSVDLDTTDDSLQFKLQPQFKHLDLKKVFDGSVNFENNDTDHQANQISVPSISDSPIQKEMLSVSKLQVTNNNNENNEHNEDIEDISSEHDDDEIDFKSVVSRVTERMTLLGDKLKSRTSSVSYPNSDTEH